MLILNGNVNVWTVLWSRWIHIWTFYGLVYGLTVDYIVDLMDYTVDCLWTT